MHWFRRWRRRHGRKHTRTQKSVNAQTFSQLQEQRNGQQSQQSLSIGDPRLLRTERPGDRIEDAIVGGHTS